MLAFGCVRAEGAGEPALSFGGEAKDRYASVIFGTLALNEASLFGATDEVGHCGLSELEALGKLGDRRLPASVGGAFDHQQQ